MAEQPLTEWDTHLCDCFENTSTCCYGFWCCPCLACTVSGQFGECYCLPLCDICSPAITAAFGVPLCAPPGVLSMRAAMRNRYGIKGKLWKDIAISCFCSWCAWCQMHRELKHRKKTPVVINMQNQTVVMQQPPAVMVVPQQMPQVAYSNQGFASQPGFVNQPGFNQPGFNQPGFNQPAIRSPPPYDMKR